MIKTTGEGNARYIVPKLVFDGKRIREAIQRRTIDYMSDLANWIENRLVCKSAVDYPPVLNDSTYLMNMLPPSVYEDEPINAVCTRYIHTSVNKVRCPVNVVRWNPEGRRLITGCASGEFTLWNGFTFNFETILQAHDSAVRCMEWSHSGNILISADHTGIIKYWQPNLNNIKQINAHKDPVRALTFSPSDSKFASCSDDGTIKIWSFNDALEERTLTGHGWDVKCLDWHPTKSLLASGSKDNLLKLWDPKSGCNLTTLHGHKNTIFDLKWNKNGNWLLTVGRDQAVKLYDIRMMKEMQSFKGHKKEVNALRWHPVHESLFCTSGSDGSILTWLVGLDKPVGVLEEAHDQAIWTLDWYIFSCLNNRHPVGHLLVSGSNDHCARFWARHRPQDTMQDRYILGKETAAAMGLSIEDDQLIQQQPPPPQQKMPQEYYQSDVIPGMGQEHQTDIDMKGFEHRGRKGRMDKGRGRQGMQQRNPGSGYNRNSQQQQYGQQQYNRQPYDRSQRSGNQRNDHRMHQHTNDNRNDYDYGGSGGPGEHYNYNGSYGQRRY
ncbi:hypothetical protein O9G_000240 [Rozella allomycis CSF55]|uniref:Polyadenylation factor subunit 2 n=1 Tax=Rozella allomycis (strain CSF55) TaxID=988480 RepID=A0A075ASR8_ROZAC|nr:hypothetical protein O9G_000240 [Rozella allomycis CSF55]|eukprot:EPZ31761.1 hypothetical protein O9G_000240 [Rozella allomycis CSF55]